MFEDVIVQNEPAVPSYCEHSFVTWRAPLRSVELAEPAVATTPAAATAKTSSKMCAS